MDQNWEIFIINRCPFNDWDGIFTTAVIRALFPYFPFQQISKGLPVSASSFSFESPTGQAVCPPHSTQAGLTKASHDLQTLTSTVLLSEFLSDLIQNPHMTQHL